MLNDILIRELETVKDALKRLDKSVEKVLLVIGDNGQLRGTITDGDVRRYVLKGNSLDNDIRGLYNKRPIYINRSEFTIPHSKRILKESMVSLLPIVDDDLKVVDFITWDKASFDGSRSDLPAKQIDVPVVIMAGGKGARLEPFSKIFPKALIPIGDKPVIEVIIDEFKKRGVREFYINLNHKGEMIESYFDSMEKDYEVHYVWEDEFLGTAGSLKLLENKIKDVFLVTNCDVIVNANFEEVIAFHKQLKAVFTALSAIQHYKLPYGVVNFKDGGEIISIHEKPEYTLTINTGVYLLDKKALSYIPEKMRFDMPDLIRSLIKEGEKVVTYPVNESDYVDIGQWEEYKKAAERLQCLR